MEKRSKYKLESLKIMQAFLHRRLREESCSLKDKDFGSCHKVLNGKAIVLQENGK